MRDLTRSYRPGTWDEIVGQEVLIKTLQKEIETKNIGQAYLFSGIRGTGKTTSARVFGNAINAQIIELDAASNGGVDHIRDLKNDVMYQPTDGKTRKMYIIDEVHQLSTSAQNAFLKVLEEPPAHVIFVLATTDPQKILPTIISRVQRFELKRITEADIVSRLKYIAEREDIQVDVKALEYIAKSSDGGMRDAIKLLQKCSSLDDTITVFTVIDALGSVDPARIQTMIQYLLNKDVKNTVAYFNELVADGVDTRILLADIVTKLTSDMKEKVVAGDYTITNELELASALSEFSSSLRNATQIKVLTELQLIKICCTARSTQTTPETVITPTPDPKIPTTGAGVGVITPTSSEIVSQIKSELESDLQSKFEAVFMQLDALRFNR